MNLFLLKIFTLESLIFSDNVYKVCVRSIDGDVSILAGHIPYLTVISSGKCKVFKNNNDSPVIYECKTGFLIVTRNSVDINLEICKLSSK